MRKELSVYRKTRLLTAEDRWAMKRALPALCINTSRSWPRGWLQSSEAAFLSLSRDAFTLEPAWGSLPPRELSHTRASPWQLCTHCGCIPWTQATFNAVTKVTQTGFKDLSLPTISPLISFPSQPPPLHTR